MQMLQDDWYNCRTYLKYKLKENLTNYDLSKTYEKVWYNTSFFTNNDNNTLIINPGHDHKIEIEYTEKCDEDYTSICYDTYTDEDGNTRSESYICTETTTHSIDYECSAENFIKNQDSKIDIDCGEPTYVSSGMENYLNIAKISKKAPIAQISLIENYREQKLYDYNCDGDYSGRYNKVYEIKFDGGLDSYKLENRFYFFVKIDDGRILERSELETNGRLNFSMLYCSNPRTVPLQIKMGATELDDIRNSAWGAEDDLFEMKGSPKMSIHLPILNGSSVNTLTLKRKGSLLANKIRKLFKEIEGQVQVSIEKFHPDPKAEIKLYSGEVDLEENVSNLESLQDKN